VVASSLDVRKQADIRAPQAVNSGEYLDLHMGQIFREGMSFSGNERDKLWIQTPGPAFSDLSDLSGADSPNDGRAVIAADFDDDGDVDLFVHQLQRERHTLLRNDAVEPGKERHGLALRLRATSAQHEAIGATVTVRGPAGPVAQVLSRGAGFVSCQAPELVFGLGQAEAAEVEVLWPGGRRESFGRLRADRRWLLVEGRGEPTAMPRSLRPLPDAPPGGLRLSEGDRVPVVELADATGVVRRLDLAELGAGKPVLLNLWASFCAPCVTELPLLVARHGTGEIVVVAVSLDVPADRARAQALLRASDATFPAYFLPPAAASADAPGALDAWLDLDRLALPTSLVVSPEGRVEAILRGPLRTPADAIDDQAGGRGGDGR